MTETINFFQEFFMFTSLSGSARLNENEIRLAEALIDEARGIIRTAAIEARNGETAQALVNDAAQSRNRALERNFAAIAVWHYENSAQNYRRAAAKLTEAGKIHVRKSKNLNSEAREMSKQAALAENAVRLLRNLAAAAVN